MKVSSDDLRVAAEWLDMYESEGTDATACRRVSAWLLEQADGMDLKQACRSAGISVTQVRKALQRKFK